MGRVVEEVVRALVRGSSVRLARPGALCRMMEVCDAPASFELTFASNDDLVPACAAHYVAFVRLSWVPVDRPDLDRRSHVLQP